jgi:membrane glycosyltransferase
MPDYPAAGTAAAAVPEPAMTVRRLLFWVIVLASMAGLLWLLAVALSAGGGLSAVDYLLLVLFAVTLPWSVIGFWNAAIGFLVMRFSRDMLAAVIPPTARIRGDEPITAPTAIALCIRNEMPDRVIRNLEPMLGGFADSGFGARFHVFVLSDTNDPETAAVEEERFAALAAKWHKRVAITYRRRTDNTGYKAGNVRDFCERWGGNYEFVVTLDADSFMSAAAILRLVRIMQADPKLGILQSLVVGLPSTSAFARIFQFGMRLGMRSYTTGSAWWQGDCGPYWGHNAVVRLKPFIEHCHIPPFPDGTHIMSHDQLEAVLMRRAGYDVRVMPKEDQSWEENPPTLMEFIRRDLRWCMGNMQYWPFLILPGLRPVSRYQLAFALLMFLGSPAWMGLLVVGTLVVAFAPTPGDVIRADAGYALFAIILVMWFAPKIATVLDILTRSDARRAFGGTLRFLVSVASETIYFIMLSPIMWFGHTVFLTGLAFGYRVGWGGQSRDDHTVPWSHAFAQLWPQTALGAGTILVLAITHPGAIVYALFIAGGLALSIPLAVITSWPSVGVALARIGIGRLPEETSPPPALSALALPAIELAANGRPPPAVPQTGHA